MEDFASYILNEENYIQKMVIAHYLSNRTGIFFDKSIVLRTQIAKMFMDYSNLNVDKNLVLTAVLLCNCKKVDNSQKIGKLEIYAREGAEFLSTLGFNSRFCRICEQLNRYSESEPREPEGDVLELIDQFTGLILRREEREAFLPEEALIILKERNLKNANNRYLDEFVSFVNDMEKVTIRENIEVPVLRKLVKVYNDEPTIKGFIAAIGNRYAGEIDKLLAKKQKADAKELLTPSASERARTTEKRKVYRNEFVKDISKSSIENQTNNVIRSNQVFREEPIKDVGRNSVTRCGTGTTIKNTAKRESGVEKADIVWSKRALFNKETAERVLRGIENYRVEEEKIKGEEA